MASDDPAVALLTAMDADTSGIATSMAILDDWDESDRAKVNPIVGQAGVAAGAGAVGATVQRVTLASDDPGVALLTTIDGDTGSIATLLGTIDADTSILAGLVLGTQADDVANTADGLQTTSFGYMFDGTTWDRVRGTSTDGLLVNLGSNNDVTVTGTVTVGSHAVTNAGTFAVQESGSALTALQLIDDAIYVDDADWTDSTSKHVLVGGLYQSSQQTITDGDVGPLQVDANGNLKVNIIAGAGSGGTALTDDAAFTAATTSFTPVGGIVTSDSVDSGDGGAFAMLANRQQKVTLYKSDGTEATYITANVDDASTGTDAGIPILAIRDDSLSTLTPVEGDFVALRVSSTGALHVTGGGGGTEYTEDVATANPIVGTATMMERDDALSTLTPIEGDWAAMRCDANGALWVNPGTVTVASHAVTNAGTFVVQENGAALTALQLLDNAVYVDDADWTDSTSSHLLVGGLYQGTPQTVTDGDVAPFQIDSNGALKVAIVSGAGSGGTASADDADFTAGTTSGTPAMGVYESSPTSVTDGDLGTVGITQTRAMRVSVDNTVTVASHAVTNAGTFAVQIDAGAVTSLALIDDAIHADDAAFTLGTSKGVMIMGFAGTQSVNANDAAALACETDGALHIHDGGNTITVDGTVAVTGVATAANQSTIIGHVDGIEGLLTTIDADTGSILTAAQLLDNIVVAHDSAISGATGVAVIGLNARSAEPTAVGTADATQALGSLLGKQVTLDYAIPPSTWTYAAASGGITNTTGVTAKAAAGAGIRNYITGVQAINGHATVSTDVQIRDGASGTVLWRGFAQAAGGGCAAQFNPPLRGTANTLVEVACGTTGTATYINLQGFVAAE